MSRLVFLAALALLAPGAYAEPVVELKPGATILFLGDSITHAGGYISEIESRLRTLHPESEFVLINLGLPSETCSGLSEPAHPFPRPDVHERLERALTKVQPDIVFACYGMNDGIYYPFSEERFDAYQKGLAKLIARVKKSNARLVLMTPPPFDPLPLRKKGNLRPGDADEFAWFAIYEGYDSVLDKYADWVLDQKKSVDLVIDLHTPVNGAVAKRRKTDAEFTMSGDGVHLNSEGHMLLADIIWKALGYSQAKPSPALRKAVAARQGILHAAWVSHVGHKRPGVKAGLPLEEAKQAAAAIPLP